MFNGLNNKQAGIREGWKIVWNDIESPPEVIIIGNPPEEFLKLMKSFGK